SVKDTRGYHLETEDGHVGQIGDFLVDEHDWRIAFLVVDTSMWWAGRRVLIDPRWTDDGAWANKTIRLSLQRWMVKDAPSFDPDALRTESYQRAVESYFDAMASRCERPAPEAATPPPGGPALQAGSSTA